MYSNRTDKPSPYATWGPQNVARLSSCYLAVESQFNSVYGRYERRVSVILLLKATLILYTNVLLRTFSLTSRMMFDTYIRFLQDVLPSVEG